MDVPVGIRHHLVLVGGGHSHVEVLRDWAWYGARPSVGNTIAEHLSCVM